MDWMQLALACGVVLSLVLHYLGRKSATAEKVADLVDEAEGALKK